MERLRKIFKPEPLPEPAELAQAETILRAMPANTDERYSDKDRWNQWGRKFVDFYGSCSEEQRDSLVAYLSDKYADSLERYSQTLWLLEVAWDFGQESPAFDQVPDLFERIMKHYQQQLEIEQFNHLIVYPLVRSKVIPPEYLQSYDHRPHVPSPQMINRMVHVSEDAERERRLLLKHELPSDPDDLVHMLKRMAKGKMGLPDFPDFLLQVQRQFGDLEEWEDIEIAVIKLMTNKSDWYKTQIEIPNINPVIKPKKPKKPEK